MVKIRIERIQIDVNVTFRSFIRIFQKISNNDAMHLCAAWLICNSGRNFSEIMTKMNSLSVSARIGASIRNSST